MKLLFAKPKSSVVSKNTRFFRTSQSPATDSPAVGLFRLEKDDYSSRKSPSKQRYRIDPESGIAEHATLAMHNPSEPTPLGSKEPNSEDGACATGDLFSLSNEQGDLFEGNTPPKPSAKLELNFAILRPLNFLVVDDNDINRKVIRTILEKLGYQSLEAPGGKEALAIVSSNKIDYIFTDLDMPEMSGIETAATIRANEANSPTGHKIEIIAVTANISDETRLSCKRAGMNGFLEKPISLAQIKDQLLRSWARIRPKND